MEKLNFLIEYGVENEVFEIAKLIREKVFIEEQNADPDLDVDDNDQISFHFVGNDKNNNPVCCARVFKDDKGHWIGRIAVLKEFRKMGYASQLVGFCESYCWEVLGANTINIHSQKYIADFYKSFGFKETGLEDIEEGIEHFYLQKNK
ncbi:acetyltransferase, GNAT family protein [Spiroplasma chinense]|uniref:Acetyltransferase, GNAT family protein n=1 Tax=Spiroplasma chinense TaxID=216932 RepID=A0A5B9Y2Z6_9MOLU|nr:GNAT family N-acetyltransferase [Spiroplasma chinense]QEH61420.1 acetyltransferase, GNAT family protein [Spiroplasma chinense]